MNKSLTIYYVALNSLENIVNQCSDNAATIPTPIYLWFWVLKMHENTKQIKVTKMNGTGPTWDDTALSFELRSLLCFTAESSSNAQWVTEMTESIYSALNHVHTYVAQQVTHQ